MNGFIELRGGRQHNLKNIDLDLPLGKLIVVCGVSGSGKTSLALDTLHAEGQRRFVESFSPYARQYLQRWTKPAFDRLDSVPPSIAIAKRRHVAQSKLTVGLASECYDFLRLLFAHHATLTCDTCQGTIEPSSAKSIDDWLASQDPSLEAILACPLRWVSKTELSEQLSAWQSRGYVRVLLGGKMWNLGRDSRQALSDHVSPQGEGWVAIDRLRGGKSSSRSKESLEAAFRMEDQSIAMLVSTATSTIGPQPPPANYDLDGTPYWIKWCPRGRVCLPCQRNFADPNPHLFHILGTPTPAPDAFAYRIDGLTIRDVLQWTVQHAADQIGNWTASMHRSASPNDPLQQILLRLHYLDRVGLRYLSLDRPVCSLSLGEAQRVAMTSTLCSDLTNMLYVLDEPSAGLHPSEVPSLWRLLVDLRDRGNTVFVVEHDLQCLNWADHVIELGPRAGAGGGQILYQGEPGPLREWESPTGIFLRTGVEMSGEAMLEEPPMECLSILGANGNGLADVDLHLPIGGITVVTGPSGSGKRSLVVQTLYRAMAKTLRMKEEAPLPFRTLHNASAVDEVELLTPHGVGAAWRTHPVTWVKAFDGIRQVFADQPEAKLRNWSANRFSFHHASGRCSDCEGSGLAIVDMQFLADVELPCATCQGQRYQSDVLNVTFRQKNIADVMEMSAEEAIPFFRGFPVIQERLQALVQSQLGHIGLGQPTETLSFGEQQALRLAPYLLTKKKKRMLTILENPTAGLHPTDVAHWKGRFQELALAGHTLVLIDNHPMLRSLANSLVEMEIAPDGTLHAKASYRPL